VDLWLFQVDRSLQCLFSGIVGLLEGLQRWLILEDLLRLNFMWILKWWLIIYKLQRSHRLMVGHKWVDSANSS
jgi:hypothetical protein